MNLLKRAALAVASVALISGTAALTAGPAFAGQPNVECEDIRPGHASSAPGSAFNEHGTAGTVYAGVQPQNTVNSHTVSQYDVACLKIPAP